MEIADLQQFKKLEEALGNKYAAVRFLSQSARQLGKIKKEYQIPESKLIQWVLTGQCPYSKSQLEYMRHRDDYDGIDEFLSWVIDNEVKKEVKNLYAKSVKRHSLSCCERIDMPKSKVERINILLRMVWFSANIQEGEL